MLQVDDRRGGLRKCAWTADKEWYRSLEVWWGKGD